MKQYISILNIRPKSILLISYVCSSNPGAPQQAEGLLIYEALGGKLL